MERKNIQMMKIPLIKPYITEDIRNRVMAVLDSGILTEGAVTHEFEKAFAGYVKSSYAIAVTSCTTGLEIALRALGIGPGDEVIVPDYTYPATAMVVGIVGANCVIVDVDRTNMLIDYDALEAAITSRTKVIIPVSLFGNPLDYDKLDTIRRKYNLYIVEDAACSIGAEFRGVKVGTLADITVFSLHPRKFITTGEGGMVTTENEKWAAWMNSYKHFGMAPGSADREGVSFSITGTNYKLTNIQAAIGLGQLEHIDELLGRRRSLASVYDKLLAGVESLSFPIVLPGGIHSLQSYCILVEGRDKILKTLRSRGIEVQIGTYSLHMHDAFKESKKYILSGSFEGSAAAFRDCLTLPLFHDLSLREQEIVINGIKELI